MQGKFEFAFPDAPESFDQAIFRALHEEGGARPVRHVGRRLLIAACLLLILSAVCYAMVKGFGILDLLRNRGGARPASPGPGPPPYKGLPRMKTSCRCSAASSN